MSIPTKDTYNTIKLLFEISRELVSNLDLRIVLQRILSLSMGIIEAQSASIIILNPQGDPTDAAIILDGKVLEGTVNRLKNTLDDGLAGWVVRNRQPALVADTSKDQRWMARSYPGQTAPKAKSSLCIPLLAHGQLVGVITFTNNVPASYTEAHLELVQAIADQAAIAVLNAQLFQASQQRADVMAVLAETSAAISASLDINEVLNRILNQISRTMKVEAVSIGLIDKASSEVVFQAVWGQPAVRQVGQRLRLNEGVTGWVAQHGESAVVPDVMEDVRFSIEPVLENGARLKAIAAAPILSNGEIIGVLEALNPAETFSTEDLLLLKGIGGLAGTAIRHAQLFEELQRAHGRYRQLFEDSIDPIFISDWDGKLLEANQEAIQLSGYSKSELLSMQIYHFCQVDWKIVGINYKELANGDQRVFESYLQPKLGPSLPIEVHVHAVKINNQDGLQWIMRDITELKKLERLREDLTSMIYHDLRSPLSNVVSGLDLIRSMVPEDLGVESVIQISERSLNRVQRLISSLLDTSRLQAGQKITSLVPVIMQKLVAEAVEVVRPAAEATNFDFEVSAPEKPIELMVDTDMIRRVLINLMENALKYSAEGHTIQIKMEQKDSDLFISIKDQGRGISPEDQQYIFERYMRSNLTTKNVRGVGLGLAFCKLAIEGHGGEIWVESELGKGSTFIFKLPIKK
jgi:NtrC-family two-component system sensor histidine kinase KinB